MAKIGQIEKNVDDTNVLKKIEFVRGYINGSRIIIYKAEHTEMATLMIVKIIAETFSDKKRKKV